MQNKTWKQTLIEINELKGKLQETINHAIRDFEEETGCGISKLDVVYLNDNTEAKPVARVCRIDVVI